VETSFTLIVAALAMVGPLVWFGGSGGPKASPKRKGRANPAGNRAVPMPEYQEPVKSGGAGRRWNPTVRSLCRTLAVIPGLVPGIHAFRSRNVAKTWMAGTDPRIKSGDGHDEVING
jgi:hypothetical protein